MIWLLPFPRRCHSPVALEPRGSPWWPRPPWSSPPSCWSGKMGSVVFPRKKKQWSHGFNNGNGETNYWMIGFPNFGWFWSPRFFNKPQLHYVGEPQFRSETPNLSTSPTMVTLPSGSSPGSKRCKFWSRKLQSGSKLWFYPLKPPATIRAFPTAPIRAIVDTCQNTLYGIRSSIIKDFYGFLVYNGYYLNINPFCIHGFMDHPWKNGTPGPTASGRSWCLHRCATWYPGRGPGQEGVLELCFVSW